MLPLVVQLALDDRRLQRGKWQLLTASSFEYEKLSGYSIAAEVVGSKIPPGPSLSTSELRYCFELVLGSCRTKTR